MREERMGSLGLSAGPKGLSEGLQGVFEEEL